MSLQPELIVTDERVDLIEHRIDMALTVGELPDSDYKAQRVGSVKDILFVSKSFLEKTHAKPDDINNPEIVNKWPYIAHQWEGPDIIH